MANATATVEDMSKEDVEQLREKLKEKGPSDECAKLPFDSLNESGAKPGFVGENGGEGGA